MKKIISVLAALSIICGIGASTYTPFVSADTVSAAEVGKTDTYDLENSSNLIGTVDKDGMVFDVYKNDTELYAVLTSVKDESLTEFTVPSVLLPELPSEPSDEECEKVDLTVTVTGSGFIDTASVSEQIKKSNPKVVGIADGAFKNCKELGKINLSKNIAVLNWDGIAEYFIAEITVDEENKNFTAADGILYSKDMKILIGCPPAIAQTEIKVSDKTEEIGQAAFVCCKDIKKSSCPTA